MNKNIFLIFMLFFIVSVSGCVGGIQSTYQKGVAVVFNGKIDNIILSETIYKDETLTITSVGFNSGQGVTLIGVHPGLSEGKNVNIRASYFATCKGTDMFKLIGIKKIEKENKVTANVEKESVVFTNNPPVEAVIKTAE